MVSRRAVVASVEEFFGKVDGLSPEYVEEI